MKKTILIAAVLFFTLTVAAFGQATLQVASTPVTQVASCGTTELTGDIAFTQVSGSLPITTGTITINYGVPITTVTGATVTIKDSTGAVITGPTAIAAGQVSGNLLTLSVLPPAVGVPPYTIILTGVRVNVAGNPGLTSLSATVSSTGNLFVGGQTSVVVISAIGSAIASVDTGAAPGTALTISSVNPAVSLGTDNDFSVRLTEGFANAWVQNAMFSITFSAIPAGLQFTAPASANSSSGTVFQRAAADGTVANTTTVLNSASASLTVYYKVVTLAATAAVDIETVAPSFVVALQATAVLPLAQSSVQVTTVDMAPRTAAVPVYTFFPQYSGTTCQKGPATVLTIVTANTVLLMPYATTSPGYDTGLAISNTTADPLAAGITAVVQNGALTFNFYPQTGTPFNYTTSATSPGEGLASGVLNSGRTYTVLLSKLLAAAAAPANFTGYIFVTVNSTNAHGQYFISDFEAFTNGALMLVVDPAKRRPTTTPESFDN